MILHSKSDSLIMVILGFLIVYDVNQTGSPMIVKRSEKIKNARPQVFSATDVLKNFAKIQRKIPILESYFVLKLQH